jgi:predicted permease
MVVSQVAVSVILLAGAALLVRSFARLQSEPLGLQSHGVVTATISLNRYRYTSPERQMQFFLQVEEALRRLPGISAVGLSDTVPPGGYRREHIFGIISVEGRAPMTGGTGGMVAWRYVTPDYFKALEVPIVRGQPFTEEQRNSTGHVVIISSLLASRLFSGENPVGKHIKPTPDSEWFTIQGVAANVKNAGLNSNDEPEYYLLRRNTADDWRQEPTVVFEVKTALAAKSLSDWIRAQVEAIDPTVPIEVETLDTWVGRLADRPRFETALLSFFAAIGLLMAIIGLYGLVAFMAQRRTQEIGVRMALGATQADVLRLILGQGMRLVLIGGAIGLCAALTLARMMQAVLFKVTPHDPLSFVAVAVLLALVGLLAILVPARAAMKTDPMAALRWE